MLFRKSILLAIFTLTIILLTHPAFAGVLYVKEGGTGNGTSWADAFGDPQEAIELAAVDDDYSQVWVAAGTYFPTGHPNDGFRAREAHFSLRNGVAVYGGFVGNEAELEERDFEANETIFSGDYNQRRPHSTLNDQTPDHFYFVNRRSNSNQVKLLRTAA